MKIRKSWQIICYLSLIRKRVSCCAFLRLIVGLSLLVNPNYGFDDEDYHVKDWLFFIF